eukprot:1160909-Pelagomonas_calceolata.AAC.6
MPRHFAKEVLWEDTKECLSGCSCIGVQSFWRFGEASQEPSSGRCCCACAPQPALACTTGQNRTSKTHQAPHIARIGAGQESIKGLTQDDLEASLQLLSNDSSMLRDKWFRKNEAT